jgi:putative ABC transport system ATP-binding protein
VRLNREQGHTFVLVTHDATVARRAHRIVRMRDGLVEGDELTDGG